MPNRLSKESSPYLLQHAHNPVDWYPWGEEALKKAKEEDKPILVSIGYSACHWCHVMERESFEDNAVADIMNAYFINIKIDREERPDLDHIYMDAVQAMTGSGGWPLNVFLTPAAKPFYGGTYFPPRRAYNRPSWTEILQSIRQAYQTKRDDIEAQAETLTSHLSGPLNFSKNKKEKQGEDFTAESLGQIREKILQTADRQSGGFGHAPKFPQTFIIQYLLRDYYLTGNQEAVEQAFLSLDKMIQGGIYDQIGGGFARYATDNDWLVPHFEKMLYDNALLVSVISEAWQVTRKDHYREAITQTLDFIARELTAPDGGFYSALDADSEGEEGKYYVWERQEVENLLGKDAGLFCEFYDISEGGNWEGRNIPHIRQAIEAFAIQNGLKINELEEALGLGRQILLKNRSKRIRPQLDDKQLLGWNALMITAYCKAFAALGIDSYRDTAIRSMEFIWQKFRGEGIRHFHHSYKNGKASIPAFLDDYASLIQGLIQLQEITGDAAYLLKARELTEWVLENFSDPEGGQFYFTHRDQEDLIIRKKEIYDGAVPSGNSVMASNLLYLSIVFDKPDWKEIAERSCKEIYDLFKDFPGSFGVWATLAQGLAYGMNEIVVTGKKPDDILKELLSIFLPFRVLQSATTRNDQFPLLLDKPASDQTLIFLCRDYSCQIPVTEVHELVPLLETVQKF